MKSSSMESLPQLASHSLSSPHSASLLDLEVLTLLCLIDESESSSSSNGTLEDQQQQQQRHSDALGFTAPTADGLIGLSCPVVQMADLQQPTGSAAANAAMPSSDAAPAVGKATLTTCSRAEGSTHIFNEPVKIFVRLPYLGPVSVRQDNSTGPGAAELIGQIIEDHHLQDKPCFFLLRRIIPSNTKFWLFIIWLPNSLSRSNFILIQVSYFRNLIHSNIICSRHNYVDEVVCSNSAEIRLLFRTAFYSGVPERANKFDILKNLGDSSATIEETERRQLNLRDLPLSLSDTGKEILSDFGCGAFNVLILEIDDIDSCLFVSGTLKVESLSDLQDQMNLQTEPKYCLLFWKELYYLLLIIPEARNTSLRFMYSFFKQSAVKLVQDFLKIKICRSLDVRQGDNNISFLLIDNNQHLMLMMRKFQDEQHQQQQQISLSAAAAAAGGGGGDEELIQYQHHYHLLAISAMEGLVSRPRVSQAGSDPFSVVVSVANPKEGTVNYERVSGMSRFRF